ncbi:MAG: hypothetical protein R3D61_05465 [Defluviimonas denitrificans]
MGDYFPELTLDSHNSVDGTTYAVTEKFGYVHHRLHQGQGG